MTHNHKKSQQLGIPYGTACNRLRKQVMFSLATHCGLAHCFVCDQPILSTDDFTLEHKEPWEDNDPALFWEPTNIAFSHAHCNRPHRRNRSPRLHEDGKWLCRGCGQYLDVNKFSFQAKRKHPRQHCKQCRSSGKE